MNKVGEAREILSAIGQPSEKQGIKWTKYFMDKFEKKEWEKNQLEKEKLGKHRLKRKEYYRILAKMLLEKLVEVDKPRTYQVIAYPNSKGVIAQFRDRFGRVYQKAFRPCGIPKIDHWEVERIVGMAEDKMYALEERSEGGVWLTSTPPTKS